MAHSPDSALSEVSGLKEDSDELAHTHTHVCFCMLLYRFSVSFVLWPINVLLTKPIKFLFVSDDSFPILNVERKNMYRGKPGKTNKHLLQEHDLH